MVAGTPSTAAVATLLGSNVYRSIGTILRKIRAKWCPGKDSNLHGR
jgi:hypothetical protein